MQKPETELKFSVPEVEAFLASLARLPFSLLTPRTLEQNTLFDTPERNLRARRELLRLRLYGPHHILTHKRVPEGPLDESRFKTRIETETEVADAAAVAEVFHSLGLDPVFRYEKYRTEWEFTPSPTNHLLLDETPIGTWAELEGEPAWIDDMLDALLIPRDRTTTASYGSLFLDWKARTGSLIDHLTFDLILLPDSALQPQAALPHPRTA